MERDYRLLKQDEPFWPNKSVYFLTDSTFLHFPYFNSYEQKLIVLEQIKKINKKLSIPISAFSIAINHYHLKFFLEKGLDIVKVKQLLRGGISFEYRKNFSTPYKDLWQTRKTIIVLSQEMDYKVTGYIIGNLLKHKEVGTFDDLKENEFSSYCYTAEKYGDDYAREIVGSVIDIDEDTWGGVDLKNLSKLKFKKREAKASITLP